MSAVRFIKKAYLLFLLLPWLPVYAADLNLVVKEAFVNVHTGPSSLHPVFYVVTRGKKITVLSQKTQWVKIKTGTHKIGWVYEGDIAKTMFSSGEQVEFDKTSYEEFSKRSIEVGVQTGSLESSPAFSLSLGYLFNDLFSTQLSVGQAIGQLSSVSIISVDALMTPYPKIEYSPYFVLGVGSANIKPNATLINPKTTTSSLAKVAVGIKKYLGERFIVRLEWANYTLFSADNDADSNEEVTEWKVGFSTFF